MKTILTAFAIGGFLCCASAHPQCCAPTPAASPNTTAQPIAATDGRTVTLKVTGMTCELCAKAVERALKNLDGVITADVSLGKKQAVVTVDAAKVKTEQLIAAVNKAGGDRHTFQAVKATVFKCDSCGMTYDKAGSCCGAATKKVQ